MNDVLIIIGIEALFLLITLFILIITTKRVDILLKSIFVDRMQEFDYLIDERETKSKELNDEIEKKGKELKRIESSLDNQNVTSKKEETNNNNTVIINSVDFEDDNIVEKYKNIKETLSFNKSATVLNFIKNANPQVNEEYDKYKKIRDYFTYDVIYKITSFNSETQKEIINELLTSEENELVKDLINQRFKINSFIDKLENQIVKTDYHVYVYTGDKNDKFDELSPFIKTVYDEKITEGIKIRYKGKIYDLSI